MPRTHGARMSLGSAILTTMLRNKDPSQLDQIQHTTYQVTAEGPIEVIAAPGTGQRIVVLDGLSQANANGTEEWLAAATLTNAMTCVANAPKRLGVWVLGNNEALNLTAGTAQIEGWVTYVVVAA